MNYTIMTDEGELKLESGNRHEELTNLLKKNKEQLVKILLIAKEEAITFDSELLPCWRDKDEYKAAYEQYSKVNDEQILDFVKSIYFLDQNFVDCNFKDNDYMVGTFDIPWESGYDGGTSLEILFKGDNIVFACNHFDKMPSNDENLNDMIGIIHLNKAIY